jgi:hypothetical protein
MPPGGTQYFQCLKAYLAAQIQQFSAKFRKIFLGAAVFAGPGRYYGKSHRNVGVCR